jgi:hypothetical protein
MGSHNARNANIMGSWFFFILEHSITFFALTYYGFKRMEEVQGLFIQYEKSMGAAGIEPVTSRWKTSTLATKARGLVDILRASFFDLNELATSAFWLNLSHSRRPKQTFVKYASLVYEPGATKLSFLFNSGPKKVLSLSLNVKCDQQTHKKMMPTIMASILKNHPTKFL